jgi:hypothetical protein
MASNIQDGVYNAMPTVAAVYEKNNALKLEIHFTLCDESGNAYTQTGTDGKEYPVEKYKYYTLVNAQGAVNTKVVEGIRAWSKWDGTDPFWWTDVANVDAIGMVEVTLKTAPSFTDPSKTYQNVEWVNELGHNAKFGGGKITESGDNASAPATAKVPPAPAPSRPAAPTKAQAEPGAAYPDGLDGANIVWDAFCAANKGAKKADLEERWFAALDRHGDANDQAAMTGGQWAKVAAELAGDAPDDDIPF